MKIFVGLGNPGPKYDRTRHNSGFMWIDRFRNAFEGISLYNVSEWKNSGSLSAWVCEIRSMSGLSGEPKLVALLVKPTTYMNLSGICVREVLKKHKVILPSELFVVHDDLDMELGKFKLQSGMGPKGHKGVISINSSIGTEYMCVRLGVDDRTEEDRNFIDPEDYVLMRMKPEEIEQLEDAISKSIELIKEVYEI